jgi:hypothetical protein
MSRKAQRVKQTRLFDRLTQAIIRVPAEATALLFKVLLVDLLKQPDIDQSVFSAGVIGLTRLQRSEKSAL